MKSWSKEAIIAVVVAAGASAGTAATVVYRVGGIDARLGRMESDVQSIRDYLLGKSVPPTREIAGRR